MRLLAVEYGDVGFELGMKYDSYRKMKFAREVLKNYSLSFVLDNLPNSLSLKEMEEFVSDYELDNVYCFSTLERMKRNTILHFRESLISESKARDDFWRYSIVDGNLNLLFKSSIGLLRFTVGLGGDLTPCLYSNINTKDTTVMRKIIEIEDMICSILKKFIGAKEGSDNA